MNAIVLKWLSLSLISTVVLCALWLAQSVRVTSSSPMRDAVATAPITVVAAVR